MTWRLAPVIASFLIAGLAAACTSSPASVRPTPTATSGQVVFESPSASQAPTPTGSPPASATASPAVHYASRCATAQLALAWGGRFSEATGQNTLGLILTNTSGTGCHLFGYPGIALVDAYGRVLPMQYVWGGDQMVTSSSPTIVELPPSGTAYILVNKYRCDTTDYMHPVTARVIPPDDQAALQVSIVGNVPLDYCGPGDPGSILHISPVEPSFEAAGAH